MLSKLCFSFKKSFKYSITLGLLSGFLLLSHASFAQDPLLPLATNLEKLAIEAKTKQTPIAILFSAKGLKSTHNLKEEALLPAIHSGVFDGLILFREINVNTDDKTIDFYGEATPNSEFKQLYNLTSLPVLLFFNADGEVLTKPLLAGAYDFYFHYLKATANEALIKIDNPQKIP